MEAEGGGMLVVTLEAAQLLHFACFPVSKCSALTQTRAMEQLIVGRAETGDHPAPNHLTVLRVYPCLPERDN